LHVQPDGRALGLQQLAVRGMTFRCGVRARAAGVILGGLVTLACSGGAPTEGADGVGFAEQFLAERSFRRHALEAAVVDPANTYSALRLAEYALEKDGAPVGWDALDEWNPPVRPLTIDGARSPSAPVWEGRTPSSDAEWLELGRRAFELWPVELDDRGGDIAMAPVERERVGMWTDARGRAAGLVYATTADGFEHAAWTCSGCHARPDAEGRLVHGAPAAALDRGAMSPSKPDGSPSEAWTWGPGRLDVTADGVDNPTTILDLRATSHQSHLHWEATLKNDLPALAVRVETLLIENAQEHLRPPREVAVALALFVESLGKHGEPGNSDEEGEGARVFEANCAGCHHADGSTAEPLPVEVVGTDPRAAESGARGHGYYRIPSLWAVADRGRLLHDGSIPDLATFLDPERARTVPGHPFGLDLSPRERESLIAFLATIGN
jgi:hypothetical protein